MDERLGAHCAGVIARPFTKWAFVQQLVGVNKALDNDLGPRREWQTSHRTSDDLYWRAPYSAGP
ncbi:MAG TPA: hypothetical protein VKU60_11815, partial [Chloroflexota bacterium]|nr:hypothetical protein [Chloroflexota bacterium]